MYKYLAEKHSAFPLDIHEICEQLDTSYPLCVQLMSCVRVQCTDYILVYFTKLSVYQSNMVECCDDLKRF
jgi:hypothetical protein